MKKKVCICKWCHTRHKKLDVLLVKDGPIDRYYCDFDCLSKYDSFRHSVGVANVLKLSFRERIEYLEGKTIDEFISDQISTA